MGGSSADALVVFSSVLTIAILLVTYGGLALGKWPGLGLNRPTIALVGAAALVGVGAMSIPQAWQAMDARTMVFLLSMMVVNGALSQVGIFARVLQGLVRHSRHPLGLLLWVTGGTGVLSAFLLNDTLALVATPLVIQVTQALRLNPVPYLLALAAATNIGSVATISGNPQNILVGSFSGISYGEFARVMTPVAVAGLGILVGLIWWFYPEVRSRKRFSLPPLPDLTPPTPEFWGHVLVTVGLFGAFVAGVPLAEAALVTAAIFLCWRRDHPEGLLAWVDWGLLVLFAGLFILTQTTRNLGIWQSLASLGTHTWVFMGLVTLLSNLISNVPTVLLLHPLIAPDDTQGWLLLAAASTLAGNLTLFGAVANLITVEAAGRAGYPVSFWTHFQLGLPLTLLTLIVAYLGIYWR
ncbi:MAG: anion transporter [Gloeomargarita sp. SKYG116]|nr:anion transporter [Gloeomargarita sp. SKYG116]MCS7227157.1 anion transporter [Gloeomargarita sp. SKYB31]MDW8400225.1 anion transporter [Gloeomargarita sp. SKYGB_i_bin116]